MCSYAKLSAYPDSKLNKWLDVFGNSYDEISNFEGKENNIFIDCCKKDKKGNCLQNEEGESVSALTKEEKKEFNETVFHKKFRIKEFTSVEDFKLIELIRLINYYWKCDFGVKINGSSVFLFIREIKKNTEENNSVLAIVKNFLENCSIDYALKKDRISVITEVELHVIVNKVWENNTVKFYTEKGDSLLHSAYTHCITHIIDKQDHSISDKVIKKINHENFAYAIYILKTLNIMRNLNFSTTAYKLLSEYINNNHCKNLDDILLINLWYSFQKCQDHIKNVSEKEALKFNPGLKKLQTEIPSKIKNFSNLDLYVDLVGEETIIDIITVVVSDKTNFETNFETVKKMARVTSDLIFISNMLEIEKKIFKTEEINDLGLLKELNLMENQLKQMKGNKKLDLFNEVFTSLKKIPINDTTISSVAKIVKNVGQIINRCVGRSKYWINLFDIIAEFQSQNPKIDLNVLFEEYVNELHKSTTLNPGYVNEIFSKGTKFYKQNKKIDFLATGLSKIAVYTNKEIFITHLINHMQISDDTPEQFVIDCTAKLLGIAPAKFFKQYPQASFDKFCENLDKIFLYYKKNEKELSQESLAVFLHQIRQACFLNDNEKWLETLNGCAKNYLSTAANAKNFFKGFMDGIEELIENDQELDVEKLKNLLKFLCLVFEKKSLFPWDDWAFYEHYSLFVYDLQTFAKKSRFAPTLFEYTFHFFEKQSIKKVLTNKDFGQDYFENLKNLCMQIKEYGAYADVVAAVSEINKMFKMHLEKKIKLKIMIPCQLIQFKLNFANVIFEKFPENTVYLADLLLEIYVGLKNFPHITKRTESGDKLISLMIDYSVLATQIKSSITDEELSGLIKTEFKD